jgi:hypothetical protein
MQLDADYLVSDMEDPTVLIPHDLPRGGSGKLRAMPEPLYGAARMIYRRLSYRTGRKTSPFELYESRGIVFIHVPKNAGTFVNGLVYPDFNATLSTSINAHHSAQYLHRLDPVRFRALPKFSILRHPAARLRSAFNYLKFHSPFPEDQAFAKTGLSGYDDFEHFCATVGPKQMRALRWWPHFRSQASFVCAPNGRLMIDALIVLEDLSTGLAALGAHLDRDWGAVDIAPRPPAPPGPADALVAREYQCDLRLWTAVWSRRERLRIVKLRGTAAASRPT